MSTQENGEKKEKPAEIESSTKIQLDVPNSVYFAIKRSADKKTEKSGEKHTIHDECVELLAYAKKAKRLK